MKQLIVVSQETVDGVIESLEKVGFVYDDWYPEPYDATWKFLKIDDRGVVERHNHMCGVTADHIYSDSYAIAHADQLEGAREREPKATPSLIKKAEEVLAMGEALLNDIKAISEGI